MIIDTSALVAIIHGEEEADAFVRCIEAAPQRVVSAASYLELSIVIDKLHDAVFSEMIEGLLVQMRISMLPVTASQARLARDAYRRYGRGSGHPAKLNFGDCFSYALAKERALPLLFKGDDFGHTDVAGAPYA